MNRLKLAWMLATSHWPQRIVGGAGPLPIAHPKLWVLVNTVAAPRKITWRADGRGGHLDHLPGNRRPS